MRIITHRGAINTEENLIVLMFNNDDELNAFITKLANTEVKTSGARVLTLVPENKDINPIQKAIIDIIGGLDGINSDKKEINDSIADNAIEGIKEIINKHT